MNREGKNAIAVVNELCQQKFGCGFNVTFKKTENVVKNGKNVAVSTVTIQLPTNESFTGTGSSIQAAKLAAAGDALDAMDENYQYWDPVW